MAGKVRKHAATATAKKAHVKKVRKHTKPYAIEGRKTHAIRPHHAKPYRKRHYSLLVVSVAAAFFLFGVAVTWTVKINNGQHDVQNFLDKLFGNSSSEQTLSSSYGFSFSYDPKAFEVSAINGTDGKLYVGQELLQKGPYQTYKLSSSASSEKDDPNAITVDYMLNAPDVDTSKTNLNQVENQYIAVKNPGSNVIPQLVDSKTVTINGYQFVHSTWNQPVSGTLGTKLQPHFVTYTTVLNKKPLIIRSNNRLSDVSTSDVDDLVKTLEFGSSTGSLTPQSKSVASTADSSHTLLGSSIFASLTATASGTTGPTASQLNSALYSPAVVKIYNVYCMDVTIDGKVYLRNACDGLTGSGFFVSNDGYIATNGHVATSSPKDLVLKFAIAQYVNNGDLSYLQDMVQLSGISDSEVAAASDPTALLDTIINDVYNLPDSRFGETNNVSNLLVDLTNSTPDVNTLLDDTENIETYPGTASIKHAKLTAYNYRALDGIVKYRDSDVAIIKIDGSNYPVVTLGSIDEAGQGANLSIMGYPGEAQDNGIVSGKGDSVTLTSGKVSAIKTANGDSRKLIQTDTTIGHGNSGGPALVDSGDVVGIATYSVDGSGQGGGVFNYVRDIADLKALASSNHITIGGISNTQNLWKQGITYFYNSHYSKSLKYFDQVKSLDPEHPTVASFISNAQTAIKEGKDVKDFPVVLVLIGAGVALAVAGVAVFLIMRQHSHHQIYKLATGQTAAVPVSFPGQPTLPPAAPVAPNAPVTPAQAQATAPSGQLPANPVIAPTAPPSAPANSSTPQPIVVQTPQDTQTPPQNPAGPVVG